jgi:hypothetical protein
MPVLPLLTLVYYFIKSRFDKVKFVNKGIHQPCRVVGFDLIVKCAEGCLMAIVSVYKLHAVAHQKIILYENVSIQKLYIFENVSFL